MHPRARALTLLLVAALGAGCRSSDPAPAPPTPGSGSAAAAVDPWAPQAQRPLDPPTVTHPMARPMFWTATRGGKTTYVFGTLHLGVAASRRIPLWVWHHFDEARTLVLEANIQDIEMVRWTLRSPGPTLHAELGDAYWAKFEAMVTPLAASFLDGQATAVAALRASGVGGGAADQSLPMDGELLVRAQGLAKQLVFLEDAQTQGALFTELFDLAMLRRVIDHADELAPLNPQFFDAYLAGDDARLAALARAQFRLGVADDAALDRFLERLLRGRNQAWVAALERVAAEGGAFVAVGALHLTGPGNVLELLRARGFEITRPTPP